MLWVTFISSIYDFILTQLLCILAYEGDCNHIQLIFNLCALSGELLSAADGRKREVDYVDAASSYIIYFEVLKTITRICRFYILFHHFIK